VFVRSFVRQTAPLLPRIREIRSARSTRLEPSRVCREGEGDEEVPFG